MPILKNEKEILPDITNDATILIQQANISKEKLEEDLRPYEENSIVVPEVIIPAHHLECAYKALIKGASVQNAARVAGITEEKAQTIKNEIDAIKTKLATATPINKNSIVEAELPGDLNLGK